MLSNLTELNVSFNSLTALPEELGSLNRLTSLNIASNKLEKLPDSIGRLSSLTQLHARGNQLRALPEAIVTLAGLTHLDVSWNKLTCLPKRVGEMCALQALHLGNNQIKELPSPALSGLTCLKELSIPNNLLTDLPLSELLEIADTLTFIDVDQNPFTDPRLAEGDFVCKWIHGRSRLFWPSNCCCSSNRSLFLFSHLIHCRPFQPYRRCSQR